MILPSSIEHLDRVCELEKQFGAEAFSRRSLRRFIMNESLVIFVDNSGYVIGYAIVLRKKNSYKARLYSFMIDEKFRGNGLGSAYLSALIHEETGVDGIILEASENNEPAIRMYHRAGFEVIQRVQNYYKDGSGAIKMLKKL
jgi:ribosomal-protein-alanine N-acetyltransferase